MSTLTKQRGVTLIELLIAIGIMAAIAGGSVLYLFQYKASQDLDGDWKRVIGVMRDANARAITQDSGLRWGVRFLNNASPTRDFYYLISSNTLISSEGTIGSAPSATLVNTYTLGSAVQIKNANLSSGNYRDYIFEKLTGEIVDPPPPVTMSTIFEQVNNTADFRTITVNTNGTVTY